MSVVLVLLLRRLTLLILRLVLLLDEFVEMEPLLLVLLFPFLTLLFIDSQTVFWFVFCTRNTVMSIGGSILLALALLSLTFITTFRLIILLSVKS